MKKAILFYGALGRDNKYTVGGGETGNYRTIHLLEKNGINVITLHKPYPVKNFLGYIIYVAKMFLKLFSFYKMLRNSDIKAVHISGFYLHLIYHEYLLVKIAKLLNKKCIYELRGGGVKKAYTEGSSVYRFFFKATVNSPSTILCQGESYIPFLKSLTPVIITYYPNFVLNDFLMVNFNGSRKNATTLQLVYFGRIVESKNPEMLLSICRELLKQDVQFKLEIIGSGEETYVLYLKETISKLNLNDYVLLSPPAGHKVLKQKLADKHFFLFPSNEVREGHSNALTEAMALGIVPVCSNAGFNAEIVNDPELVIEDYDPFKYASTIQKIWKNKEWKIYSDKVALRIKNTYTEQLAEKIILKAYDFNL